MNPIINRHGTKNWYNEKGLWHRTDGPAIEYADGSNEWFLNGVRHRTDGPALHRTDGPACEYAHGSKAWYLNGVRHRTDGPAIEGNNGSKSWYLNGTKLTEDLFLKLTGPVKNLPLYLGLGFDLFISERLQHESCHL